MTRVSTARWSEERVAVVTGGGSGIGLAICERLAADGAAVAVTDRDGASAETAAAKLVGAGHRAIAVTVDVTDRAQIDAAVAEVRERLGRPTILVNSAGLTATDKFRSIPLELWNRVIEVNLTGTFQCCQAVLPDMLEAGWGRIVNISSSSAQGGVPFMTHYVAAKAGVIGFTKALALEVGPKGITVNTIPPGFVDTPMLRASEEQGLSRRQRRLPRRADAGPARRVARRTSPPPVRSSWATRRRTSPARSSASTADATPEGGVTRIRIRTCGQILGRGAKAERSVQVSRAAGAGARRRGSTSDSISCRLAHATSGCSPPISGCSRRAPLAPTSCTHSSGVTTA